MIPTVPAMTARYHLNLVTPFVLLAAAATPALLRAPAWARAAAALYLAASPLVHRGFIRDVDYFEMREFAFLTSVRDRIPDRCTLLEFQPAVSTENPSLTHGSRLARVGSILDRGSARWSWEVVPLGTLPPPSPGEEPHEVLSPVARAILRAPRPCTMVYLGLTCASHRPLSTPVAPVCAGPARRSTSSRSPRRASGRTCTTRSPSGVWSPSMASRTPSTPCMTAARCRSDSIASGAYIRVVMSPWTLT
ncbi:MAG: hypothetical protein IPF99_31875 [Deltaproteobacteria bacterium]|nr:hypothetical protein [Deltaproteobacteria bacterium]